MITYEQLEHQRKNPHLYTTPTQSVNFDGTIITYDQVTEKLQKAFSDVTRVHNHIYGVEECRAGYCGGSGDSCNILGLLATQLADASKGFVKNYVILRERMKDRAAK